MGRIMQQVSIPAGFRLVPSVESIAVNENGTQVLAIQEDGSLTPRSVFISNTYPSVYHRVNGKSVCLRVHRLVAEAWIGGKPFHEAQVCHADGTRTNNHYTNLRWGSSADNAKDSVKHGTHTGKNNGKRGAAKLAGSRAHLAKVNDCAVLVIRYLHSKGTPTKKLASAYRLDPSTIRLMAQGKIWKHLPLANSTGFIEAGIDALRAAKEAPNAQ